MKKLLAFTLILVMASMSSALLQIKVGGADVTEITVAPSDNLVLSILTDAVFDSANTMALVVNTNAGAISGGVPNPAYDGSGNFLVFIAGPYGDPVPVLEQPFPMTAGQNGIWGGIAVFSGSLAAGSSLITDIAFHCEAPGDALVQLIQLDDMSGQPTGLVYDSVMIHQVIPEPATIALLCLGGLLLRKRS